MVPGPARLQPRSPAGLQAGQYRSGGHACACRWATRSSPGNDRRGHGREIVEGMERRYGQPSASGSWTGHGEPAQPGLAQEAGRRYGSGRHGASSRDGGKRRLERDWQRIREDIEVKLCPGPEGAETFLLCRSAERRQKEHAMHERFSTRIETGLERLGRRLSRAKQPVDRSAIERQLGRLLERNRRAAKRYRIRIVEDSSSPARVALEWSIDDGWDEHARRGEGCYVLRTNVADWTGEAMWQTYIGLWEVEQAFRIHKSELAIPAHLAPEGRTGPGAHPGLLPGLRALEDARAVAGARWAGQQPADDRRRARPHPEHRRDLALVRSRRLGGADSMRDPPRSGPGAAPRPARFAPAGAASDRRSAHGNIVPTRREKCPENLDSTPRTAEVGLEIPAVARVCRRRAGIRRSTSAGALLLA